MFSGADGNYRMVDVRAAPYTVTSFINGWCPGQNLVFERAKRASAEFGDKVVFQGIDTSERDVFLAWGISDALFIRISGVLPTASGRSL